MTDSEFIEMQLNSAQGPSAKSRWGILLTAVALALIIGFSAADIQSKRFGPATQNSVGEQVDPHLDGRGKWGGYLK